jgi:hypothetical protein
MFCPTCRRVYQGGCPKHGVVSVVDDSLDLLVQQASAPNLATLFRAAKASGAITAGKEYGEGS